MAIVGRGLAAGFLAIAFVFKPKFKLGLLFAFGLGFTARFLFAVFMFAFKSELAFADEPAFKRVSFSRKRGSIDARFRRVRVGPRRFAGNRFGSKNAYYLGF